MAGLATSIATPPRRHRRAASAYANPVTFSGISSIYPTGFLPQINTHSKDLNTALGVKGQVAGWSVDAKVSYGQQDRFLDQQFGQLHLWRGQPDQLL
jgi:hypothetical protein